MAMRNLTMDQLIDRVKAQTVACQHCGAKVGETCVRTDYRTSERTPVENFPAHHSRLKRAERIERLQAADAEREAALSELKAIPLYENPHLPPSAL